MTQLSENFFHKYCYRLTIYNVGAVNVIQEI